MHRFSIDRRRFLKLTGAAAGAGLIIGINWGCSADSKAKSGEDNFSPNAWLRISPENVITVIVAESEMGQGPYTLMPMMVAEELEVAWDQIKVERASIDPVYGYQLTGGSTSIRKGWSTLREAGALAREILIQAAAKKLQVSPRDCLARQGKVIYEKDKSSLSYGELVGIAVAIELPEQVFLKDHEEFNIIGTSVERKDIPAKVNGTAEFGIDIRLPGQLYATVIHCPVFGGKIRSFGASSILKLNGVIDVFVIDEGVAIVATDTWRALNAAKKIKITWDYGNNLKLSETDILDRIKQATQANTKINRPENDLNRLLKTAASVVSAEFVTPFLAHMAMEPMNSTTYFKSEDELKIWAPTQSPSAAYGVARNLTQNRINQKLNDLGEKFFGDFDQSIEVNTTLLGGGFGRRLKQDYVSESVQIARRFKQPVQLVWSREEDVQHDFYHPMSLHALKAVLDHDGYPKGWEHVIKGSVVSDLGSHHSYDIAHQYVEVRDIGRILPQGPWRSVAAHYNVFAVEHFLDILAVEGNHDPMAFRLQLLTESPRLQNVLKLVAQAIDWQGRKSRGNFYGCAAASSFGSHVAQIVELKQAPEGGYRVTRVVCAIDCGVVINPDIVKQQMEGSIIFALSAATQGEITLKNGRVEQSNFHDFPILRMRDTPNIEVIIESSQELPGGIGEPAVPPLAPALANAIFAATGKPVAKLPVKLSVPG
jgi:isoquinoline 1-oxidoreductase beta subunit